uniref:Putative sigma54 specific transcriptional regulator, Fis family n=1 Tax=Magnetococcus massalia (strain MO-1) TaxID=451514 RepID=A0A1S7LL88_MAGMO|nr:Putative sigma54 specific transcriptional regulator, Fis family [Candidatus Magnetococcus massalia]
MSIPSPFLTRTPELQSVLRAATLVAQTDVPVLVQGERGSGKAQLAYTIHQESPRRQAALVNVKCATLQGEMAESTLFGHLAGVGHEKAHGGLIGQAVGGTLFLDEVEALPLELQAKLLPLLEQGLATPVGSTQPHRVDVRLIISSHVDLARRVADGRFREDLFYRINMAPLTLLPLRDRPADIPLLVKQHLATAAQQFDQKTPRLARNAMQALKQYNWPGNMQALQNLCTQLAIYHGDRTVEVEDLPLQQGGEVVREDPFVLPHGGVDLANLERELIEQALSRCTGNKSKAARLLGLTRDTLLYRLKKYAIEA